MKLLLLIGIVLCGLDPTSNALHAAELIIYLYPEQQASAVPRVKERFVNGLKARGVPASAAEDTRFVLVSASDAEIRSTVEGAQRTGTKIAITSTYVQLRALLPIADRPLLLFETGMSNLMDRLPSLANHAAMRTTGVNYWTNVEPKMIELLTLAGRNIHDLCAFTSSLDLAEGTIAPLIQRADAIGMRVKGFAIATLDDLAGLIATKSLAHCDAFAVFEHAALMTDPRAYIEKLNTLGVPAVFAEARMSSYGALIALEPNVHELYEHFLDQVAAVLKGVPIEALPIARPTNYIIAINVATARKLRERPDKRLYLRATSFYYD